MELSTGINRPDMHALPHLIIMWVYWSGPKCVQPYQWRDTSACPRFKVCTVCKCCNGGGTIEGLEMRLLHIMQCFFG